ncbi:MAG: hypothetical protein OXU40_01150 [Nitrospira sp.]|nr:hypothetical protein [Nitrospira sp.]
MSEQPVYAITPKILTLVEQIGEAVGRVEASGVFQDLRLQRINRVRQIHGTLAMAGNSLSEEQISAILEETWLSLPKRPRHRPSSRVACRPSGKTENHRRTDGGTGPVAPPRLPQKLPPPGNGGGVGGDDAS